MDHHRYVTVSYGITGSEAIEQATYSDAKKEVSSPAKDGARKEHKYTLSLIMICRNEQWYKVI